MVSRRENFCHAPVLWSSRLGARNFRRCSADFLEATGVEEIAEGLVFVQHIVVGKTSKKKDHAVGSEARRCPFTLLSGKKRNASLFEGSHHFFGLCLSAAVLGVDIYQAARCLVVPG